jgi:hypothetical protein
MLITSNFPLLNHPWVKYKKDAIDPPCQNALLQSQTFAHSSCLPFNTMKYHTFLLCYIGSVIAAVNAQTYTLNATIPWHPKAPSSVDQSTIYNNTYYLSDRTNGGVQVISLTNDSQITIIGGFTTTIVNNTVVKTESGPNGLTVIPDRNELYASDAHGIVKIIDLFSLKVVANISIGGIKRADEIGYDPTTSTAIISNGDDATPFVAVVNTTTQTVLGKIMFPGATGLEQPTINPADSKFYVAVDSNPTYPGGAIAALDLSDPSNFSISRFIPLSDCIPGGIAFGSVTNQLFVSCSGSQFSTFGFEASYIIDVTTGDVKANISGVSGVDQVAYSPATTYFYATAYQDETNSGSLSPYLFVIAANGTIVQKIVTDNITAHSVAVEAGTGTLVVPVKAKGVEVYDLTSGTSSTNASSTATGSAAIASATSGVQNLVGNVVAVLGSASLAALMLL